MGRGTVLDARPRWTTILRLFGPIGVLTAASLLGTLTAPALVEASPLLLIALSPRLLFLVVAADAVPPAAFFLVGLARLTAADPFHYLIGRHGSERYSESILGRSPTARRIRDAACQAVQRAGPVVVALRPNAPVLCAAGACRVRPWIVAAADLLGTCGYLGAVWFGGRFLVPGSLSVSFVAAAACLVGGLAALAGLRAERRRREGRRRRTAVGRGTHPCLVGRSSLAGSAPCGHGMQRWAG